MKLLMKLFDVMRPLFEEKGIFHVFNRQNLSGERN